MLLSTAYEDLLRLNLRIQGKSTKSHYRIFLKHFGQYLGETPLVEHLTEDNHSGFARWLMDRTFQGKPLSRVTVNQRLHYMRALWRHCCRRGYLSVWPTSMGVPEPERIPVSWTEDELARIWSAFDKMPGRFCTPEVPEGIPKNLWWRAFHEVVFCTGERKAAILDSQWSWLRGNQLLVPAEHRKGKRQSRWYTLKPEVMQALSAIRQPERELIFPVSRSSFYIHYHRLLKVAGVDGKRRGPQQMRRTHASLLARCGGDPTKSLGHSTSRVTERYYLDPSVAELTPSNALLPDPPRGKSADRA